MEQRAIEAGNDPAGPMSRLGVRSGRGVVGNMDLIYITEYRFGRDPSGKVVSPTGTASYRVWEPYLHEFASVTVAGRLCTDRRASGEPVTGPGVIFHAIPHYIGPREFLLGYAGIRRHLRQLAARRAAVVLRVPSALATVFLEVCERNRPFACQVVGDPHDVFAAGAVAHPLRRLWRWWFTKQLRRQCDRAAAVSYVTRHALQRRYPCSRNAFSAHFSNVELGSDAFTCVARQLVPNSGAVHLVTVGSLGQLYKGTDVLLHAMRQCADAGVNVILTILGDGAYRRQLERLSVELGVAARVRFMGQLPAGTQVRQALDNADVFVLPSRTEGLPRALIEAMARGLPCIASRVGGVPELLPNECLVKAGDAPALARAIGHLVQHPEIANAWAERNLRVAHEYEDSILSGRRQAFCAAVRACTCAHYSVQSGTQ